MRSNIVISRSFSAYFLGLPLISVANAEEESAFFGGSFSQNRPFPRARKAILRASTAAAQIARSARKSSAHAPRVTFNWCTTFTYSGRYAMTGFTLATHRIYEDDCDNTRKEIHWRPRTADLGS